MARNSKWITPFTKQCFVTSCQSVATAQFGLVMSFTCSLLPELRRPDSVIIIDDSKGSWIVATPAVAATFTSLFTPFIIGKCGRKSATIIILVPLITSWLLITIATDFSFIIIARFFQGFSLSVINCLSPMCVGEYTSPKNRGAFLGSLSLSMVLGTLIGHAMGSFISWHKRGLISALITFVNLIMVLQCPESPSWLVDKGRYDDAKKAFHWLRGDDEDDELEKMIAANIVLKETNKDTDFNRSNSGMKTVINYYDYVKATAKKPEFYKPIFIMLHLNLILQFTGTNVLASYAEDIYRIVVKDKLDVDMVIISVDVQRLVTNFLAMYVIRKVRRKVMLLSTVLLNIVAYFSISAFLYARTVGLLPDLPYLGMFLLHLLLFSIASGSLPVPLIIAGEIFPLEYRSFASVFCMFLSAPITFAMLKSVPGLIVSLGLHGTFSIYGGVLVYCLIMSWIFLPETKDRTLQDIEDRFRSKSRPDVIESSQALMKEDQP